MILGDLDLTAWLDGTRDTEWPPGEGQLLVAGDQEVQYVIDEAGGTIRVGLRDRGATPRGVASCSDLETAARIVVIELGSGWRFAHRFGRLRPTLPTDVTLEETPLGVRLEWEAGWVELLRRESALPALVARAARAPLSVVAASIRDPHGAPLFSGSTEAS